MVIHLKTHFLLDLRTSVVAFVLLSLYLLLRHHHSMLSDLDLSSRLSHNFNLLWIEENQASARTQIPIFGSVGSELAVLSVYYTSVSALLSVIQLRLFKPFCIAERGFPNGGDQLFLLLSELDVFSAEHSEQSVRGYDFAFVSVVLLRHLLNGKMLPLISLCNLSHNVGH